ncbi:hypothetical protein TNCV_924511 [Trichonephila clavipes]|nr:hypothetical protein TNCV_924511 [Trichonephila clavipes]
MVPLTEFLFPKRDPRNFDTGPTQEELCQLFREMSEKKKLSLQEVLDLLQNLPSESSDVLTDVSSDKVPANYLMEFSSVSEDDQETEQDPGCSISCSENTVFPTTGLINIRSKPHSKSTTCNVFLCINEKKNGFPRILSN